MAFVVCEPCFDCKYTDCVTVCPMECFYEDEQMLYIHPEECIDCDACQKECPVEAIFPEDQVPEKWHHYIQLNAEKAMASEQGETISITEQKEPKLGGQCGKAAG